MRRFPKHFAQDVIAALEKHYAKIKMQEAMFNRKQKLINSYTFCLVNEEEPFNIEKFTSKLKKYKKQLRINFAMAFLLCEKISELWYFHSCYENSTVLKSAYCINKTKRKI